MSIIKWDAEGKKQYESGASKGVLYVKNNETGAYGVGVPWNGLTAVNENPSGAESTPLYANNKKYINLLSAEDFGCTIEAFTYPEEFEVCDGSAEIAPGVTVGQQPRRPFGLSYRTEVGDDVNGIGKHYKLHIVYNCQAAPAGKEYGTINESPEAMTFSWEITTTPVEIAGFKPTATLTLSTLKVSAEKMKKVEDLLYGTADVEPKLPTIEEVLAIVKAA